MSSNNKSNKKDPNLANRSEFKKMFGVYPNEINILICTPCYGGQLFSSYFHSVLSAIKVFDKLGIKYGIKTIANESLVTRARNVCVSYFLSDDDYTHLMFIDADVSFGSDSILKLLRADKDVISGVYPKKTYMFEKLPAIIKNEPETWYTNIREKLADYVVNFYSNRAKIEKNCIRVKDAPTGFMLIKRSVFEDLKKANPNLRYKNDLNLNSNQHKEDTFWLFFDCILDKDDRRYLSEDYSFCRLVQDIDKEIWIDVTVKLDHTGMHTFKGDLTTQFDIE